VSAHRQPTGGVNRRRLLGFAALGAVPVAGFAVHRSREPESAGTAPPTTGSASPDAPSSAGSADAGSAGPTPSAGAAPVLTSGGGAVPYRRGTVLLGSYLDLEGMSVQEAQALRRRQLGREQKIVHLFYRWTDSLPSSISYLPAGAVPMVSWRGCDYDEILSGRGDAIIERAARTLSRLGRPTLLRWGWEMNGDWYAWGGARNGKAPGDYIKCWRRLHDIFVDQGAKNVSWVWSVNWNPRPDASWNQYADYYPGDKYVDWVGASGYNLHRETPDTMFRSLLTQYGTSKPIMISEVGAVDRGGSTKAGWITAFSQWVKQHPAVGAVTWFDTDTHPTYHERWRIDTDPKSLAAYKAMGLDPHFAG
jgi:hypothetical protein